MTEVGRSREWADSDPPGTPTGKWECELRSLNDLYGAALNYVAANPPEARSDEVLQAVLFGSALDNEDGHLAEEICRRRPAMLVALAGSGLARGEPDAK